MQVWGIYKLRLEQHLIYSSEACVMLDVAKGPGSVGLPRVLTKRIYREHIIRPRLVCKSILIKVLANTSPLLSQLMRNFFTLPQVPLLVKSIYS